MGTACFAGGTMKQAAPITVFSWGYWGWGTSVPELIRAFDAAERARGYEPPVFVDIRYRRNVRAPGFRGDAFMDAVGKDRYCWFQGLGNEAIDDRNATRVRLQRASDVGKLLKESQTQYEQNRRVVFFCSCKSPPQAAKPRCHRFTVARRLVNRACKVGVHISVVEWPGGTPTLQSLRVSKTALLPLLRSSPPKHFSLPKALSVAEAAALPHGSVITLSAGKFDCAHVITGPAVYLDGEWQLPLHQVYASDFHPSKAVEWANRALKRWRLGNEVTVQVSDGRSSPTDWHEHCVYTILHPKTLATHLEDGGDGEFDEAKKWVTASKLLAEAKRSGKRLAVVFADATHCARVIYWAEISAIKTGSHGTTCFFRGLRRLQPVRSQQELFLVSSVQRIAEGFIKPYAICWRPDFVTEERVEIDVHVPETM